MKTEFAITHFIKSAKGGSSLLWKSSLLMALGMVTCFALAWFDPRLIAGVNVWEKPAKFFLSLLVHSLTLSWAISIIPQKMRGVQTATWLFVFAAWAEMAYIVFRASRGEASHFNTSTPLAAILYAIMGIGAVMLVAVTAFIGWRMWQQRDGSLMREATSLGLMFSSVLGLIAGAYLSSHSSHWIGGDQSDAAGLSFFHWSTTGGDLRVAHFVGLHVAQLIPLSALSGSRAIVYSTILFSILVFAATFVMAVFGIPLFVG
jgi:hypothetical protein